jgi:predicted nucleic acid-binding protein
MIHGLDTGFLVAAELQEHADHADARATIARLLGGGDQIAIAPQVLAEFIHVATDSRRFSQPLDMNSACQIAEQWWTARDVVQVFPNHQSGVRSILTTNAADFGVFGVFMCITAKSGQSTP